MKRIVPFACSVLFLSVLGCDSEKEKTEPTKTEAQTVVKDLSAAVDKAQRETASPGAEKAANACLLAFATRLEDVLSLEEAAKVTQREASDAKKEYQKVLKSSATHELSYSWKSSRSEKMTVAGMTIDRPMPDLVAIGGFDAMELAYFKNSYRPMTKEAKENLDKQVDKSEDLKTKQQKDTAHTLGNVFQDIAASYRTVQGIGEAAAFNGIESRLYVFDRGVKFQVTVDVGEDSTVDEKKAVELARKVLARCP